MSVTAAGGFVAAGVHAGIRRDKLDLALVRSTQPATGAAMWTQNRVLAAPVVVSKQHLLEAEPQAVVINSGVANAATGAQGEADARATAERAADAARARTRAGARALDRRDRRAAAARPGRGWSRDRRGRALGRRWRGCGRRDPDHRHGDEDGGRARRRVLRRRHGEGLGDDPSQPRDDARGRHHRLSARPRARRSTFLPPRGRGELQRDLGRRRVLDERRGRAARVGRRAGSSARPATDASFALALQPRLPRPLVADRRRRRRRDAASPRSTSRALRAPPRRGRSRSASRRRRSSRPRSSAATPTGAAC